MMDIKAIVTDIPKVIAALYEKIYVIIDDKVYYVKYNGTELRASKEHSLLDLEKKFKTISDTLLNDIKNEKDFKKVVTTKNKEEKILTLVTLDNCKLLLVIDNTVIKENEEEKQVLLIADDSPVITKFFVKTFKDQYDVLVASNGNEAIKMIEENLETRPLVGMFLDLQMPIKSGYEVLEYFKANKLFAKLPVSIISGEDSSNEIERVTSEYGIIDMLQKPFNADAAKAIVNKTIQFSPKTK